MGGGLFFRPVMTPKRPPAAPKRPPESPASRQATGQSDPRSHRLARETPRRPKMAQDGPTVPRTWRQKAARNLENGAFA